MKKNVLLLGLLLTFFSCVRIVPTYYWRFSLEQPQPSETLSFSDDFIDISFFIEDVTEVNTGYGVGPIRDAQEIAFKIQNKTDSGIKINWDDLSMIHPDGTARRVNHGRSKLIDSNMPQPSTVIPPNAKVADILVPMENIDAYGISPLFGGEDRLMLTH
jgi:hypothetical protein